MTTRTYKSMDIVTFGKYRGVTIDRVSQVDPSYIRWMRNEGLCDDETVHKHDRGEFRNDDLPQGSATVYTWN